MERLDGRPRIAVTALLGRPPQGDFEVAVRGDDGRPIVIRNAPLLADGTPMPTRYWLVDDDLRRAVSTLEAGGGVRAAEAETDPDGGGRRPRPVRGRARRGPARRATPVPGPRAAWPAPARA